MVQHNMHGYNEGTVLDKISKGDELAFSQLFDRYRPRVYSVALKMLKSPQECKEVVVEVFSEVWQNRTALPQKEHFEGYLLNMARDTIIDHFKRLCLSGNFGSVDDSGPADDKEESQNTKRPEE